MKPSEAVALVAVLEAAFPRFSGGATTTQLFAKKLVDYDLQDARRGIERLVENREDTTWPSWAEVARWIKDCRPKPKLIEEPMGEPLPADAIARLHPFKLKPMPRVHDAPGEVEAKIALAKRLAEQESA